MRQCLYLCKRAHNALYFTWPLYGLNKLIHVKHFTLYLAYGKNQIVTIFITEQVTCPRSHSYFVVESGFILSLSDFKARLFHYLKTMHD